MLTCLSLVAQAILLSAVIRPERLSTAKRRTHSCRADRRPVDPRRWRRPGRPTRRCSSSPRARSDDRFEFVVRFDEPTVCGGLCWYALLVARRFDDDWDSWRTSASIRSSMSGSPRQWVHLPSASTSLFRRGLTLGSGQGCVAVLSSHAGVRSQQPRFPTTEPRVPQPRLHRHRRCDEEPF